MNYTGVTDKPNHYYISTERIRQTDLKDVILHAASRFAMHATTLMSPYMYQATVTLVPFIQT